MNGKTDILIVDDVRANLVLFTGLLEKEDIEISTAMSGEEALELVQKKDFALVLLDVMMPGMDGFETAEKIRSNPRTEGLPIIFITAVSAETGSMFKGYQLGAVDYLVKPVEPDVLKGKVRVFVELHRRKKAFRESSAALEQTVARLKESEAALQESEERYRIVAMHSGQLVYDYNRADGTVGWWGNVQTLTGYSVSEMEEGGIDLWKKLIHPEDLGYALDIKEEAALNNEDFIVQYRLRNKAGGRSYVEDCGSFLHSAAGDGYRILGTMRDITAQKDAQIIVARSNHFLQSVLDAVPDPICFNSEAGMYELVNSAMESVIGRSKVEILGRTAHDFFPADQAATLVEADKVLLEDGMEEGDRFEMDLRTASGEHRVLQVDKRSLRDMEGGRRGIVTVLHDITNRKRDEEKIKYLAMHDPLTGLPNRILFMDRLAQVLSHSKRTGTKAALLFIDLDDMKGINDSMGHEAGDVALKTLGERLRMCLREMDTAARLGGDEFVVVLQDVAGREDIDIVARRLLDEVGKPVKLAGEDYILKVSIGISVFPDDGTVVDTLLNKADMAMYSIKKDGGCNCGYYNE